MGKRILFVDDDALLRRLVHDMLVRAGFEVSLASSGTEGLDSARRHPPDLVLLDVMMPVMGGFEVCRRIRQDPRLHAMPVVILSAMHGPDLHEKAVAVGADACLTKPFRPDMLLNTVHMALQGAALEHKPKRVTASVTG